MPVWRNDMKCKYMFVLTMKILTRKGLKVLGHFSACHTIPYTTYPRIYAYGSLCCQLDELYGFPGDHQQNAAMFQCYVHFLYLQSVFCSCIVVVCRKWNSLLYDLHFTHILQDYFTGFEAMGLIDPVPVKQPWRMCIDSLAPGRYGCNLKVVIF